MRAKQIPVEQALKEAEDCDQAWVKRDLGKTVYTIVRLEPDPQAAAEAKLEAAKTAAAEAEAEIKELQDA